MNQQDLLSRLCDDIVRICEPLQLILFSEKYKPCGVLSSVKLCAVIEKGDAQQIERRLYIEVESELPFDILVYTKEQWNKLVKNHLSFASSISKSGRVLYAAD
ncbi:MAG: hypothetical protein PHX02_02395 [Oscillospiraceae bacterium]|jgi:hypothetical protein|nr:hypothetical protein [Oscillospiraceae bacterium]